MAGRLKFKADFHPQDFIKRSKSGETFKEIAAAWDVNVDTLNEWRKKYKTFAVAIKKGRDFSEAWWIRLGRHAMVGEVKIDGQAKKVNLGWYVWLTKNLFKWSDKLETKDEMIEVNKKEKKVYKAEWGSSSEEAVKKRSKPD